MTSSIEIQLSKGSVTNESFFFLLNQELMGEVLLTNRLLKMTSG